MLRIEGKANGEWSAPLEQLMLSGASGGTVAVRDGLGREYFRGAASASVQFRVGGAVGQHVVTVEDAGGRVVQSVHFPVRAQTEVRDEGGQFAELLQVLYATMLRFNEVGMTRWNGRIYKFFVRWLRDHVHTLKGMKYFYGDLTSAIDLYRESQREDGMIWDNVYDRTPEPNGWDMRFSYGDFIRPFPDYTGEFKRIPVENDVEYLFIEGIYYTWKAVGDDGWMTRSLDSAIRAMDYSITNPYRWSEKYKLLKRAFTIDTWDFQNAEDARISAAGDPVSLAFGDAMAIRVGHTRFGVMHGDNTGYIASCNCLAEMLEHVGRTQEAQQFRQRAAEIKRRLDELAWNGRFYTHHVPEDPAVRRDLGVDLDSQVSLSNAYALNRGLTHEQCVAVIKTYQGLRDNLPPGSPGEWYTIYPPFEKGYGGHNDKWQYMNGGVISIVAGELAHGAFEHGHEQYGADILRRVLKLAQSTGGHLHCTYTGSIPPAPTREFAPIDIAAQANTGLSAGEKDGVPGWGDDLNNDLREMPVGAQVLAEIPFLIPDPVNTGQRGCIALRASAGQAMQVQIPVGRKAASVYFLHTVTNLASNVAGSVTLHYADGTQAVVDVVRGQNVTGWWMPEPCGHATTVAWRGKNRICTNIGLLAWGMNNPHADKTIDRIVLDGPKSGGTWAVMGMTLCDQPVWFPPSPVSFGIPDNWGAGAVVYGLIEGLVGIKDTGIAFDRTLLAPRWSAADVQGASATVTYPASGGYAAYQYRHEPQAKRIRLAVTSSGGNCQCHVLLPKEAAGATSVQVGGKAVAFKTTRVEASVYVDFTIDGVQPQNLVIAYA